MSAPTEGEYLLINQLRERVWPLLITEEQKSYAFLLRWIRAKDHVLHDAEEMLKKHLAWRGFHGLDNNATTPFPQIDPWYQQNFPFWIDYVDKLGHPVVEISLGSWDLRLRQTTPSGEEVDLEHHFTIPLYEMMLESLRSVNRANPAMPWPITQATVVIDWEGYSYTQLMSWKALKTLLDFARMYEENYPETLYKSIGINCPPIFPLLFAVYKKIPRRVTLDRTFFYKGEEEWKHVLLELIDADQLPKKFGGNRVRRKCR